MIKKIKKLANKTSSYSISAYRFTHNKLEITEYLPLSVYASQRFLTREQVLGLIKRGEIYCLTIGGRYFVAECPER